jgi:hypothetical protein
MKRWKVYFLALLLCLSPLAVGAADVKISDLTELNATPTHDDDFVVVDTSEATTKRITAANLLNAEDVDARGGIAASVAYWNSDGGDKALLVKSPQTISADLTVNSNIHLVFLKGGVITITEAHTLTINGPKSAGCHQIFAGDGSVEFGPDATEEVYPEWFGAKADGTTDDTTAIENAIGSMTGGDRLIFPGTGTGTYAISSTLSQLPDDVEVEFLPGAKITKVSGTGSIEFFTPGDNNILRVNIDAGESSPWGVESRSTGIYSAATYNGGTPVNNVVIHDSVIENIYAPIRGDGAKYWKIHNNQIITSGVSGILFGADADSTGAVSHNIITDNYLEDIGDCAVAFFKLENNSVISYNTVANNNIKNTNTETGGYALNIEPGNASGYQHHNVFVGNLVEQTDDYTSYIMGGVQLGDYCEHCVVTSNILKGNFLNAAHGIIVPNGNFNLIAGNSIDNFYTNGIFVYGGSFITISNNLIVNCGHSYTSGGIRFAYAGYGIDHLKIHGNSISYSDGFGEKATGIYSQGDASSPCSHVTVSDNDIRGCVGYGAICLYGTDSGGEITDLKVKDNSIWDITPDGGYTIDIYYADGVVVCNNTMVDCTLPFRTSGCTELSVYRNQGFVTENEGITGSIATGTAVDHGLDGTPDIVIVTAAESGPTDVYTSEVGATSFKINFGGGGNKTFYWRAIYKP